MNVLKHFAALAVLMLPLVAAAQSHDSRYGNRHDNRYDNDRNNRHYSERDDGRRFNDGSRVVCRDVVVDSRSRDRDRVGGTVAGAVIGGVLGNQIGSGSGRKVATIGGAIAGGAIGRKVQGDRQESRGERIVERRCERVWR